MNEVIEQPIRRVHRDGVDYVLLGTAHVSRASVEAVAALLAAEPFDAVAVELCGHRAETLRHPDRIRELDLFRVLKDGRAGVVAAGLALGAYQRRLAEQFGIEPGAEMRAAMDGADARALPCWLIDRDVGLTLRRARAAVGWWERTKLTAGLIAGVIDDSEVDEAAIEKLKQGDVLESAFTEFARTSPPLYHALIAERDQYMAAALREHAITLPALPPHPDEPLAAAAPAQGGEGTTRRRVLAVIGAGHLAGIARHLAEEAAPPAEVLTPLRVEPKPSRVAHWVGIALLVLIGGFVAWGFTQSKSIGLDVLAIWVLTTGTLGAVGALAAGAHPASIVAAFIASPITPLHPALASGMVSAAVELFMRKPRVGDFQALRDDVATLKGWWRNRVARVFLVFFLTSLGTAIGVWMAGFRMAAALAG